MPKAKYQFTDFLTTVPQQFQPFVEDVYAQLTTLSYKGKMTVTKSIGFQLAFHQPNVKTTAGIVLIFFNRGEDFYVRIYGKHHKNYLDVLADLPMSMVEQIRMADNCKKYANPDACWKGCKGYDFEIEGEVFEKFLVNCFEFKLRVCDLAYLRKMIVAESDNRVQEK